MPTYRYRAKKGAEEIIEGKIEARSEKEAIEKVSVTGYFPLSVEEEMDAAGPSLSPYSRFFFRKITAREITLFTKQLATLLKAGMPILDALGIISEQSVNPAFKGLLKFVQDEVRNGAGLSSVLEHFPRLFSPVYIALVKAGEASGNLPATLTKITDYRRKQEKLLSSVRVALAYPLLMGFVGAGTVVFMLTFVIPRLMDIFSSMGQSLPLPTQILIATSDYIRKQWFYIVSAILLLYLFLRRYLKTKTGKAALSTFALKMPLLGGLILKSDLARFSRTLEILLKAGIPILQAIELSSLGIGNEVIRQELLSSYKGLGRGDSFGKSLKRGRFFPVFASNLIIVGEESGRLDEALAEVSVSYEADIDEALKIATSLLEPAMILGMGLVVGFIVVAMLLPLFQINIMAR